MLMLIPVIILIVAGLIWRNSSKIFAFQCLFLTFIWGYAYERVDLDWYERTYQAAGHQYSVVSLFLNEGLYKFICYICRSVGISFQGFLLLSSIICVCLLASAISFFIDKNKCMIFSFLLIYPIIEYSIEIQGRIAFCLIFFAMRFLEKGKLRNIIKYLIIVIIATGIHSSALECIMFVVVPFIKGKRKVIVFLCTVLIIEWAGISIVGKIISKIIVQYHMDITRIRYLSGKNVLGFGKAFGLLVWQIVAIFLAIWGMTMQYKNKYNNMQKRSFPFLLKLQWLVLFCFPLCYFNMIFFRVPRYFILLTYMLFAYYLDGRKGRNVFLRIFVIVLFSFASVCFFDLRTFQGFYTWYIKYVLMSNRLFYNPTDLIFHMPILCLLWCWYYILYGNKRKKFNFIVLLKRVLC